MHDDRFNLAAKAGASAGPDLADAIDREARAVVRCLAAAERAIEEGRFNLAKVLRAAAHASRARALTLERAASAGGPAVDALMFASSAAAAAQEFASSGDEAVQRAAAGAAQLADLLDRAAESLAVNRDVPESDVAQFLWGCAECGLIIEAARPAFCPGCGALAAEFEMFAPFFATSGERIARRTPDAIRAALADDARLLHDALAGADEATLTGRVTPDEWCMKEIAGHMVDCAGIFNRRLRPIVDPDAPEEPEPAPAPWLIMRGKGYAERRADDIAAEFRAETDRANVLLGRLEDGDWQKRTEMFVGKVTVVDIGSWLMNHNLAHRQQILALRELFARG